MFKMTKILYDSSFPGQQFLGNCCHANWRTPPRHIANVPAKNNGVQSVHCNLFPAKPFYGSHQLDRVMIWPPGLDNGAFMVSPDSVWYALVLLFFSATAQTNTGSKTFDCALVSTLEVYNNPDNGNYCKYCLLLLSL